MIDLILQTFLGWIAAFGWFFCSGHLLVEKFAPNQSGFAFIFSVSLAASAAFLALVTPWIALPSPIPLIIGIGIVLLWAWKKPSLPSLQRIEWTPSFVILVLMLFLFGIIIVLFPDASHDSIAYHIPFMQEFAKNGKVSFSLNTINWVDHARLIYPKAVELQFGLSNQLIPGSYQFLQFLILIAIAGLFSQLSAHFNIKDIWIASALFFLTAQVLIVAKVFYLELVIFCWFLTFLILILKQNTFSKREFVLIFLLSLAITMAKLTSFIYLFTVVFVAFLFFKKPLPFLSAILGISLGLLGNFTYPILHGVNILHELSILQALTTGISIPLFDRITLLMDGLRGLLTSTIIGLGFYLSFILFLIEKKERRLFHGIILFSAFLFFIAFLLSSLYHHTYGAFGYYYIYAFIGVFTLSIPLFFQKLQEKFNQIVLMKLLSIILILLFFSSLSYPIHLINRFYANDNVMLKIYTNVIENVPNESETVLFYMNNINPMTYGLENAVIYDHTTFPVVPGDPCEFWRSNSITYVVYYLPAGSSFQLDGGNENFYKSAKEFLLSEKCSTLLSGAENSIMPLVARVNYPEK